LEVDVEIVVVLESGVFLLDLFVGVLELVYTALVGSVKLLDMAR